MSLNHSQHKHGADVAPVVDGLQVLRSSGGRHPFPARCGQHGGRVF